MSAPEPGPFVLCQDDDSHWYVIPKARGREWYEFLSSEHYDDGNIPDWAEEIGGSPSLVVFYSYSIE